MNDIVHATERIAYAYYDRRAIEAVMHPHPGWRYRAATAGRAQR